MDVSEPRARLINHQRLRHRDTALESLTCLHCGGQYKKQSIKNKFCSINQCKTKYTGCKDLIHQHSPSHPILFGCGSVYICVCAMYGSVYIYLLCVYDVYFKRC